MTGNLFLYLENFFKIKFKGFIYKVICTNTFVRNCYLFIKFNSLNNHENYNNKPTLALVWQDRFNFLKQNLYDNQEFKLLLFPRIILNIGFNYYLKEYNNSINNLPLGEYCLDFYRSKKFENQRNLYITYCISIILFLKKRYNVTSFLLPKLNDPWSIDLIKAINICDLKLIIDDREGTNTPQRLKVVPERLRNLDIKFNLLTTQSYMHRDLFLKAGFPIEKIIVNGSIQSDYWKNKKFWKNIEQIDERINPNLIKILFFSFGERTYMNFYYENEKRTWSLLSKDLNNVFLQVLEEFEGRIQIIYKFSDKSVRDKSRDFERFKQKSKRYIDKNFLILLGGSTFSYDLMRHSDIIVGFQTSGMIEAMNTDRTILYTAWGDLYNSIKDTLLPIATEGCVIECRSKNEFYKKLSDCINNHLSNNSQYTFSPKARINLVNKYFSNSDGYVAERLTNLVSEVIN